jgi:hypothetical protein
MGLMLEQNKNIFTELFPLLASPANRAGGQKVMCGRVHGRGTAEPAAMRRASHHAERATRRTCGGRARSGKRAGKNGTRLRRKARENRRGWVKKGRQMKKLSRQD